MTEGVIGPNEEVNRIQCWYKIHHDSDRYGFDRWSRNRMERERMDSGKHKEKIVLEQWVGAVAVSGLPSSLCRKSWLWSILSQRPPTLGSVMIVVVRRYPLQNYYYCSSLLLFEVDIIDATMVQSVFIATSSAFPSTNWDSDEGSNALSANELGLEAFISMSFSQITLTWCNRCKRIVSMFSSCFWRKSWSCDACANFTLFCEPVRQTMFVSWLCWCTNLVISRSPFVHPWSIIWLTACRIAEVAWKSVCFASSSDNNVSKSAPSNVGDNDSFTTVENSPSDEIVVGSSYCDILIWTFIKWGMETTFHDEKWECNIWGCE